MAMTLQEKLERLTAASNRLKERTKEMQEMAEALSRLYQGRGDDIGPYAYQLDQIVSEVCRLRTEFVPAADYLSHRIERYVELMQPPCPAKFFSGSDDRQRLEESLHQWNQ